jgi:hypothetical protein
MKMFDPHHGSIVALGSPADVQRTSVPARSVAGKERLEPDLSFP